MEYIKQLQHLENMEENKVCSLKRLSSLAN